MKISTYIKIKTKIYSLLWNIIFGHNFKSFGKGIRIYKPNIICGEQYISIGNQVGIASNCWLLALKTGDELPIFDIGEGTQIGRFSHIVSVKNLVIGRKVLIADKVYISDNYHNYLDKNLPIMDQEVKFKGSVRIGDGAWIGENVSIIGVSIGKGSVVSANAVVTKDVPDYCIVAGIPAKIIKKF